MDIIQDKNSQKGLIGTILFHLLLVLLFVQFGMTYQEPPPENVGAMLINFGDAGGGAQTNSSEEQAESSMSSSSNSSEASESTASPQENIATQTQNETINMNANVSENSSTETKPTISDNLNEALNALNNSNTSSENNEDHSNSNSNNSNSSSNTGPSSSSSGPVNGIGFDLGGRGKVSFKKPENPTQQDGTVVVDIWVDKYGNVIKAIPGARGSTTTDATLYQKAKEAALEAKFTKKLDSSTDQKGTMTFVFILN